jgi:hypothetical protein
MDARLRDLAEQEKLCACGHVLHVHILETAACGGEAQEQMRPGQDPVLCSCAGFHLNAFEITPRAAGSSLDQVVFNGRDITRLLSETEVRDRDDDFRTWQLRLTLRPEAWQQAADVVRELQRIAAAYPPYIAVTPEKMSASQWVLKLD